MATCQLFIILALCILSVNADVFLSIDCGSSSDPSYTDENLISWTGDGNYTTNGVSHTVHSNNSISRVMDTLRVFTTRNKNCYSIDSIRRGRVLLRASFYYGNYDNRSSPPTFDLQFDGNHWATVTTSSTDNVGHEVVYTMKGDTISVCVAQTRSGQFPFISALEVRGLESFMYGNYSGVDTNYPLFLSSRLAFGANSTIRYADDAYDRIWIPQAPGAGLRQVTSDATFGSIIDVDLAPDRPPPAILKNAITGIAPNSTINLSMGFPPFQVTTHVTWYFSEVRQLLPNETRSFAIVVDGQVSAPVIPLYENCSEWWLGNFNVSSNTTISLVPTNVSTLPPLLNAMEVFYYGDALTNGTDSRDVDGLGSLQKAFVVLQNWSGDPCLPAPYSWEWIQCSNQSIPRVTALLLGGFGLSGVLPDFSSMNALETIDLHNNSLQGHIPDFLGTLTDLSELNLANNRFNGSVPTSISQNRGLILTVTGNPDLCNSSSCPNSESSQNPTRNSSSSKGDSNSLVIFSTLITSFIIFSFVM